MGQMKVNAMFNSAKDTAVSREYKDFLWFLQYQM